MEVPAPQQLSQLPLFPLRSVLFPGGYLPLRIFEVRYLDMIGRSDWVAILPGAMLTPEIADGSLAVCPLQAPPFTLDLVVIEAARRPPPAAAEAFLAELAARIEAPPPGTTQPRHQGAGPAVP